MIHAKLMSSVLCIPSFLVPDEGEVWRICSFMCLFKPILVKLTPSITHSHSSIPKPITQTHSWYLLENESVTTIRPLL